MDSMAKKVLFICSAQSWYTRNEFLANFLQQDYDVVVISSGRKTYAARIVFVVWNFIILKNKNQFDFIFVGFLAQLLIPFIRFVYSGKIIGDFFVSMYDTLCFDRKRINGKSLLGKLIYAYERWTLGLVDVVVADTKSDGDYLIETFGVSREKIKVIYVFANPKLFYPCNTDNIDNQNINVFFYGSCQALHGVAVILRSVEIINRSGRDNIKFVLAGPIKKRYGYLIKDLKLKNVEFIDWVEYNELPKYISQADICLGGHFGATDKARRVIAGKTFQFAAMQKPVILGDNAANREIFTDGKDCLLVEMNNPEDLAKAIIKLAESKDIRERIRVEASKKIEEVKHNTSLYG